MNQQVPDAIMNDMSPASHQTAGMTQVHVCLAGGSTSPKLTDKEGKYLGFFNCLGCRGQDDALRRSVHPGPWLSSVQLQEDQKNVAALAQAHHGMV